MLPIYDAFCIIAVAGDDCGKVVVWNMAPVKEQRDEKDEKVPKILCTLDNHLGLYHCCVLYMLCKEVDISTDTFKLKTMILCKVFVSCK